MINKITEPKAVLKVILRTMSMFICCVLLCACQTYKQDNAAYTLATPVSSERKQPTKLVPVPMPGQLMSLKSSNQERLIGTEAIEVANKKSVKQPHSSAYINSIMTFDFVPGALYQIYTAPLSITDIQFQPGERIIAVGAGDTSRWQVTKTFSGTGVASREHLLVKPIEEDLTNSLVVTTEMRTYHLLLCSTPKTFMASVAWNYPNGDNILADVGELGEIGDMAPSIDVNRLTFNYKVKLISGSAPSWFPKMVFNDGNKTYIKFSSQSQEAPTLLVGDRKNVNENKVINFRVQGNYYIVDSVIDNAQLRDGISVVQITSTRK